MLPKLIWAQLLLSSDILRTMDQTADPCMDFYQFACGNYTKKVQLPDDEASIDSFVEVGKRIGKQLRSLIEEPITANETRSSKLVKSYYKACMNVDLLERQGLEPWKALIKSMGGWPIVMGDEWKDDNFHWMSNLARTFREYGAESILSFYLESDSLNSSRRVLEVDQPGLGLGKREYYLESNHSHILKAYRDYIIGSAILLGADNKTAEKDVDDMINFEIQLANITVKDEDRTNYTELYDLVSIAELKKRYPKIPFHLFFDDMIKHGWKLNDSTQINIVGAPFMEALPDLLQKIDNRTLANYQSWDVIRGFSFYIAPSLKSNYRKFREVITGITKDRERWEQCVDSVSGDFTLAVASMYVKHYFRSNEKAEMDKMVSDIRKAMHNVLSTLPWMDTKTKEYAVKKLNQLIEKIGYPEYIFNETRLLRDKEWLELHEDRFMENAIALSKTGFNTTMRLHRTSVNKTDWDMSPADVNAMYSLDTNAISFPAAILQYPFFVSYAPISVNYARIGSVIGHEITHGYDDEGRQFGADGTLVSWWTDKTLGNFLNGSQCFTQQYSSIIDKITGYKLNGELELGENIADNGGVKLAFQAYRIRHEESKGKDQTLRGLETYTPDQLFFIAYSQTYCENTRKQTLADIIVSDTHAPNRYRVNVPLKNFQAFSDAFQCKPDTPMNPATKCSIW